MLRVVPHATSSGALLIYPAVNLSRSEPTTSTELSFTPHVSQTVLRGNVRCWHHSIISSTPPPSRLWETVARSGSIVRAPTSLPPHTSLPLALSRPLCANQLCLNTPTALVLQTRPTAPHGPRRGALYTHRVVDEPFKHDLFCFPVLLRGFQVVDGRVQGEEVEAKAVG